MMPLVDGDIVCIGGQEIFGTIRESITGDSGEKAKGPLTWNYWRG